MVKIRFINTLRRMFIPVFGFYLPRARYIVAHPEKFDETKRYRFARHIISMLKVHSLTMTKAFGTGNLPKEGGYIMYANHQGKYDALGIISKHKRPLSVLWAKKTSGQLLVKEVSQLLECEIIDLEGKTNTLSSIKNIASRASDGKPFLIFPEGKYENNRNSLLEFQTGCFMASVMSKTPIIPVVVYDSYKSLDTQDPLSLVHTQVHFLEPILYEEYSSMNRKEVCALVKQRIQDKLDEIEEERERKRFHFRIRLGFKQ